MLYSINLRKFNKSSQKKIQSISISLGKLTINVKNSRTAKQVTTTAVTFG